MDGSANPKFDKRPNPWLRDQLYFRYGFWDLELAASSKATLEIEDYLDCEVLTYGSQMHLNLLDIPKMYGDLTVYEVLNNLEVQPKIKLRDIVYRGADQLFAIVKPSTELGFVYSNSAGEYVEVPYSEAWFRIYLSES